MRYLKVMFGTNSVANKNLEYKLNKVNIANVWNPNESDPKKWVHLILVLKQKY